MTCKNRKGPDVWQYMEDARRSATEDTEMLARRWIDDILMWCDQDVKGAIQMTEDSEVWRRFVASSILSYRPRDTKKKKKK